MKQTKMRAITIISALYENEKKKKNKRAFRRII